MHMLVVVLVYCLYHFHSRCGVLITLVPGTTVDLSTRISSYTPVDLIILSDLLLPAFVVPSSLGEHLCFGSWPLAQSRRGEYPLYM